MLNKLIAVSVVVILAFGWHTYDKQEAVQEARAEVVESYNKALVAAHISALKKQNEMLEEANKLKESKDAKISTLNSKLDNALSELRNRPYRPAPNTPNPNPEISCTGTQLYREDAEFLTREANRAQKVLIERDYYYEQYELVRKKINGTE